jgi:hypothetical protein
MGQYIQATDTTYDVGLVTFQTAAGDAREFAKALSEEWGYEEGDHYLILGVRWAAAMGDESTVIAAVRKPEGALEDWVRMIAGNYGVTLIGSTVDRYYKDGRITAAAHDGMP